MTRRHTEQGPASSPVHRWLAALLIATLFGCGPPSEPAAGPVPPAADPAATPLVSKPTRPAVCGDAEGPVLSSPSLDLTCKHSDHFTVGSCQGKAKLSLINCGPVPVVLERMTLTETGADRVAMTFTFDDPRIAPGGARTQEAPFMRAGRFQLTAELDSGRQLESSLVVRNPTLERAKAQCRTCNGEFTARGMLGIVSCHCRMPDAGEPCTDGDQCQGKCVKTPEGYRCSEYQSVFGCHSYLPRGWSRDKTPAGRLRRVPSICVD